MKQASEYTPIDTFFLECQVLGDFIHQADVRSEVIKIVTENMFSNSECRKLWEAVNEMHNHQKHIDISTTFTLVSMSFFMENIMNSGTSTLLNGAVEHAYALADAFIRREIYKQSMTFLQMLENGTTTDILMDKVKNFDKTIRDEFKGDDAMTMTDAAEALMEDLEKGKTRRIPSGIRTIDALTYGGWSNGQLIIIGGRPSHGKSQIGMQFAQEASKWCNACYFTIEMTEKDLAQRAMVATGEISFVDIIQDSKDWDKFERALSAVSSNNLRLTRNCRTLVELENKITILHQEGKCDMAVIDYLQLIRHRTFGGGIRESICEITARLKQLALDLEIPIILLSQLNRRSSQEKTQPELTDLKESGSIEQDADIVVLLDRPTDPDDMNIPKRYLENRLDLYLRKNRNGKILFDPIQLQGNSSYAQFIEI